MASNPNTYSYSSSSVMSYSNDGLGEPKVFQATKSTKRAPGGVGRVVSCDRSEALKLKLILVTNVST